MILSEPEGIEARGELTSILDDLAEKVSPRAEAVHRADAFAAGRHDQELWRRLTDELGVLAMTVPEELGGAGASLAEMAVFLEASGRHLFAVPLLGAWLGLETLVRAGADEDLVAELAGGERLAALALPDGAPLVVRAAAGGWRVDGTVPLVIDADHADLLVLPGRVDGQDSWLLVERGRAEVRRRESLDLTRSLATVTLEDAPVSSVLPAAGRAGFVALRDVARLMLACEQLGVTEQAVSDAVAYACEREQFGRAIGSFQAIKHLVADMATDADLARSLVEHAVWAAVEAPEELSRAAAMALATGSRVAAEVTAGNVQVHGGIGFTWEHPAHLYFRKARGNAVLAGDRFALTEEILAP